MDEVYFFKKGALALRTLELGDIRLIHKWHNDPEVTKYSLTSLVLPSLETNAGDFISASISAKMITFGISVSKKLIGYIGISNISPVNRCGEYFIFIGDKKSWGKGYGTDASKFIIDYAFNSLNLNRLELSVSDIHQNALRLYKKLGFTVEGIKRESTYRDGKYHNKVIMAILRSEYKKNR